MLDLQRHALGPQLEVVARLGPGNLGVERRPLGADRAARHAEADLLTGRPAVPLDRVDAHVAGVDLPVPERPCAVGHDLEIVVARQPRPVAGAGNADLVLRAGVIRRHFGRSDRPVEQRGAGDRTVGRGRAPLVILEAPGVPRPMDRGPAHRLAHPKRQVGVEIAAADPPVQPAEPAEHHAEVVDDVGKRETGPGLEAHHVDALLGKLVAERAAACSGTDHDDDGVIIQIVRSSHFSRRPWSAWFERPLYGGPEITLTPPGPVLQSKTARALHLRARLVEGALSVERELRATCTDRGAAAPRSCSRPGPPRRRTAPSARRRGETP